MRFGREELQGFAYVRFFFTEIYAEKGGKLFLSNQGLAGETSDLFADGVAQADHLVPVGIGGSNGRIDGRRKRDGNCGWARKNGAVAKKMARASQRNGNDRNASGDGGVKRAQLKRADAFFRNERAFGKNENGFAVAQSGLHFLDGFPARIGIASFERKMPHFAKERADERHG